MARDDIGSVGSAAGVSSVGGEVRAGIPSPDEQHLADSLSGLAGMLTSNRAFEDTLVDIAEFAVGAVPGADGAGLTLHEEGHSRTIVASADFVREVDEVQYGLNEGPCISAVIERRTFVSGNLGGEPAWPHFGPRAGRLGVHSALSLPLVMGANAVGVLNVYAHAKNAFTQEAISLGESFAGPAAISVANSLALAQAQRLAGQLQDALVSRAIIDHAIGIVMSRTGENASAAFASLRRISQTEHVKVADIAQRMVDEATSRARARRQDPPV